MKRPDLALMDFNEVAAEMTSEGANLPVASAFGVPRRNWDALIQSYNAANKRKFPLKPVDCALTVEYVKRGIPAKSIFKTLGVSSQRYTHFLTKASDMEIEMSRISSKESVSDEEYDEYQQYMRDPLRILISDIERAEGLSEIADFEAFNEKATKAPDLFAMKMKAKFRDVFGEKETTGQNLNVQINLGGDWIKDV